MMTMEFYLGMGEDSTSLAASALLADQADHALTATCVTIVDMAEKQDASGNVLEAHIMRRAARWLQGEAEAHRIVRDELVARSGFGAELERLLKERRAAAVASREASAPLFKLCGQYMSLALRRAALDEAEPLLARGDELGLQVADAVLAFSAAIKGPTNG